MLPQIENNFEQRLSAALEPVRQFVLAQALHHFLESGIYQELKDTKLDARTLCDRLRMSTRRVTGFLHYLTNEGYVRKDGELFEVTAKAREIEQFGPWYTLIVGGYAETFQQLGQVFEADAPYASRDDAAVGAGSCGMSRYDALPLALRLLESIRCDVRQIVDLGCGSGLTLADLMEQLPGVSAVGVDPAPASVQSARKLMAERGLADRVEVKVGGAEDVGKLGISSSGVCFSSAFVLQELLEQQGRSAVKQALREVFTTFPDAHWIVIEVDNRIDDPLAMSHHLARSYYNPYFLIHYITEQRLETDAFWRELFTESGVVVAEQLTTDPRVDSTGFELGYLLRAAREDD